MVYQHLIKRTIYEAKCTCGKFERSVVDSPPRETKCTCGAEWCRFEEVSATGPDLLIEGK